ncbi:hypothetical protein NIES267_21320 [Calothrix parasitica NIES-267]|uniref:Uncharacterized protein n=1 Tax=Calothrix parasitica NIES-267 TaxID=1973488 RepID=A0A1Z4LNH6_9CYAN|nr:hypothetical protein NIES267_21320 [Calothrix parasitica NIES-267]
MGQIIFLLRIIEYLSIYVHQINSKIEKILVFVSLDTFYFDKLFVEFTQQDFLHL